MRVGAGSENWGVSTVSVPQNTPNPAAYTAKPVCRVKDEGPGKRLNKQPVVYYLFYKHFPASPRLSLK